MPNRLAQTNSLYLRKHAENPIDWWYWCDEAIETARSLDRPIFLSIGYSSCHWCTVMEHEAFSDTMIADYMNANFIAIKVDREERPDLDSIYMQAVQIMGEQGGWPLNLFLSPDDLVPFYGGTYFPIEPRYGRPGFLKVLQSICQIYQEKREEIQEYKVQIVRNLQSVNQLQPAATMAGKEPLVNGILKCVSVVINRDRGTCFPMIPYANLVLRASRWQHDLQQRAIQRGLDLALGGIFDHVGGGWHRYTVDPAWTVPHFEKMLYDNGQNLEYLSDLWASGVQEPAFKRAVAQTAIWLQREMLAEEGYFYASQDADSEGKEGKFWVWSYSELKKLFVESALKQFAEEFTVTPDGNFEEQNVLKRRERGELSSVSEACLSQLFRHRYGEHSAPTDAFPPARNHEDIKTIHWPGRVPPVTDTKAIVAWNALTISGLARAYQVFGFANCLELATNAADFILRAQRPQGRLFRVNYGGQVSVPAQAEDYALLVKALLDLYQAIPETGAAYLEAAVTLQTEFDTYLWDAASGGYFSSPSDGDRLLIREKPYQDNAVPAANGIAIANLVRLSLLTKELDYLERAETTLTAFGQVLENSPISCPSLLAALDWFLNQTLIQTTPEQYHHLRTQYHPAAAFDLTKPLPQPNAIAQVCKGFACLEPATTLEQMMRQLMAMQVRGLS